MKTGDVIKVKMNISEDGRKSRMRKETKVKVVYVSKKWITVDNGRYRESVWMEHIVGV